LSVSAEFVGGGVAGAEDEADGRLRIRIGGAAFNGSVGGVVITDVDRAITTAGIGDGAFALLVC